MNHRSLILIVCFLFNLMVYDVAQARFQALPVYGSSQGILMGGTGAYFTNSQGDHFKHYDMICTTDNGFSIGFFPAVNQSNQPPIGECIYLEPDEYINQVKVQFNALGDLATLYYKTTKGFEITIGNTTNFLSRYAKGDVTLPNAQRLNIPQNAVLANFLRYTDFHGEIKGISAILATNPQSLNQSNSQSSQTSQTGTPQECTQINQEKTSPFDNISLHYENDLTNNQKIFDNHYHNSDTFLHSISITHNLEFIQSVQFCYKNLTRQTYKCYTKGKPGQYLQSIEASSYKSELAIEKMKIQIYNQMLIALELKVKKGADLIFQSDRYCSKNEVVYDQTSADSYYKYFYGKTNANQYISGLSPEAPKTSIVNYHYLQEEVFPNTTQVKTEEINNISDKLKFTPVFGVSSAHNHVLKKKDLAGANDYIKRIYYKNRRLENGQYVIVDFKICVASNQFYNTNQCQILNPDSNFNQRQSGESITSLSLNDRNDKIQQIALYKPRGKNEAVTPFTYFQIKINNKWGPETKYLPSGNYTRYLYTLPEHQTLTGIAVQKNLIDETSQLQGVTQVQFYSGNNQDSFTQNYNLLDHLSSEMIFRHQKPAPRAAQSFNQGFELKNMVINHVEIAALNNQITGVRWCHQYKLMQSLFQKCQKIGHLSGSQRESLDLASDEKISSIIMHYNEDAELTYLEFQVKKIPENNGIIYRMVSGLSLDNETRSLAVGIPDQDRHQFNLLQVDYFTGLKGKVLTSNPAYPRFYQLFPHYDSKFYGSVDQIYYLSQNQIKDRFALNTAQTIHIINDQKSQEEGKIIGFCWLNQEHKEVCIGQKDYQIRYQEAYTEVTYKTTHRSNSSDSVWTNFYYSFYKMFLNLYNIWHDPSHKEQANFYYEEYLRLSGLSRSQIAMTKTSYRTVEKSTRRSMSMSTSEKLKTIRICAEKYNGIQGITLVTNDQIFRVGSHCSSPHEINFTQDLELLEIEGYQNYQGNLIAVGFFPQLLSGDLVALPEDLNAGKIPPQSITIAKNSQDQIGIKVNFFAKEGEEALSYDLLPAVTKKDSLSLANMLYYSPIASEKSDNMIDDYQRGLRPVIEPWEDPNFIYNPRYNDPRYNSSRYNDPRYNSSRYNDPRYNSSRYNPLRHENFIVQPPSLTKETLTLSPTNQIKNLVFYQNWQYYFSGLTLIDQQNHLIEVTTSRDRMLNPRFYPDRYQRGLIGFHLKVNAEQTEIKELSAIEDQILKVPQSFSLASGSLETTTPLNYKKFLQTNERYITFTLTDNASYPDNQYFQLHEKLLTIDPQYFQVKSQYTIEVMAIKGNYPVLNRKRVFIINTTTQEVQLQTPHFVTLQSIYQQGSKQLGQIKLSNLQPVPQLQLETNDYVELRGDQLWTKDLSNDASISFPEELTLQLTAVHFGKSYDFSIKVAFHSDIQIDLNSVSEGAPIGKVIGQVQVHPESDIEISDLKLVDDHDGTFSLNQDGQIILNQSLDYETKPSYLLTIGAAQTNQNEETATNSNLISNLLNFVQLKSVTENQTNAEQTNQNKRALMPVRETLQVNNVVENPNLPCYDIDANYCMVPISELETTLELPQSAPDKFQALLQQLKNTYYQTYNIELPNNINQTVLDTKFTFINHLNNFFEQHLIKYSQLSKSNLPFMDICLSSSSPIKKSESKWFFWKKNYYEMKYYILYDNPCLQLQASIPSNIKAGFLMMTKGNDLISHIRNQDSSVKYYRSNSNEDKTIIVYGDNFSLGIEKNNQNREFWRLDSKFYYKEDEKEGITTIEDFNFKNQIETQNVSSDPISASYAKETLYKNYYIWPAGPRFFQDQGKYLCLFESISHELKMGVVIDDNNSNHLLLCGINNKLTSFSSRGENLYFSENFSLIAKRQKIDPFYQGQFTFIPQVFLPTGVTYPKITKIYKTADNSAINPISIKPCKRSNPQQTNYGSYNPATKICSAKALENSQVSVLIKIAPESDAKKIQDYIEKYPELKQVSKENLINLENLKNYTLSNEYLIQNNDEIVCFVTKESQRVFGILKQKNEKTSCAYHQQGHELTTDKYKVILNPASSSSPGIDEYKNIQKNPHPCLVPYGGEFLIGNLRDATVDVSTDLLTQITTNTTTRITTCDVSYDPSHDTELKSYTTPNYQLLYFPAHQFSSILETSQNPDEPSNALKVGTLLNKQNELKSTTLCFANGKWGILRPKGYSPAENNLECQILQLENNQYSMAKFATYQVLEKRTNLTTDNQFNGDRCVVFQDPTNEIPYWQGTVVENNICQGSNLTQLSSNDYAVTVDPLYSVNLELTPTSIALFKNWYKNKMMPNEVVPAANTAEMEQFNLKISKAVINYLINHLDYQQIEAITDASGDLNYFIDFKCQGYEKCNFENFTSMVNQTQPDYNVTLNNNEWVKNALNNTTTTDPTDDGGFDSGNGPGFFARFNLASKLANYFQNINKILLTNIDNWITMGQIIGSGHEQAIFYQSPVITHDRLKNIKDRLNPLYQQEEIIQLVLETEQLNNTILSNYDIASCSQTSTLQNSNKILPKCQKLQSNNQADRINTLIYELEENKLRKSIQIFQQTLAASIFEPLIYKEPYIDLLEQTGKTIQCGSGCSCCKKSSGDKYEEDGKSIKYVFSSGIKGNMKDQLKGSLTKEKIEKLKNDEKIYLKSMCEYYIEQGKTFLGGYPTKELKKILSSIYKDPYVTNIMQDKEQEKASRCYVKIPVGAQTQEVTITQGQNQIAFIKVTRNKVGTTVTYSFDLISNQNNLGQDYNWYVVNDFKLNPFYNLGLEQIHSISEQKGYWAARFFYIYKTKRTNWNDGSYQIEINEQIMKTKLVNNKKYYELFSKATNMIAKNKSNPSDRVTIEQIYFAIGDPYSNEIDSIWSFLSNNDMFTSSDLIGVKNKAEYTNHNDLTHYITLYDVLYVKDNDPTVEQINVIVRDNFFIYKNKVLQKNPQKIPDLNLENNLLNNYWDKYFPENDATLDHGILVSYLVGANALNNEGSRGFLKNIKIIPVDYNNNPCPPQINDLTPDYTIINESYADLASKSCRGNPCSCYKDSEEGSDITIIKGMANRDDENIVMQPTGVISVGGQEGHFLSVERTITQESTWDLPYSYKDGKLIFKRQYGNSFATPLITGMVTMMQRMVLKEGKKPLNKQAIEYLIVRSAKHNLWKGIPNDGWLMTNQAGWEYYKLTGYGEPSIEDALINTWEYLHSPHDKRAKNLGIPAKIIIPETSSTIVTSNNKKMVLFEVKKDIQVREVILNLNVDKKLFDINQMRDSSTDSRTDTDKLAKNYLEPKITYLAATIPYTILDRIWPDYHVEKTIHSRDQFISIKIKTFYLDFLTKGTQLKFSITTNHPDVDVNNYEVSMKILGWEE